MNPFERLKEIASALGLSGGGAAQDWFDASNPVCHEAEKMLNSGRAAEAEEIFRRVLTEPRYASVAKKQLPRILLALATSQIRQKKWEAAEQSAARAWALLSELRHRTSPEFAECCRLRAEAAKGRGAREEALKLYQEGLAAIEKQKHPKPAEVVARRIEISALLRDMERWEEAERTAEETALIAGEKLQGAKEEGDALLEWALCLAGCGKFEEARETGERAVGVHRQACGDHSGEVAFDYEKLGSICQKQEDYQAAVVYLEKALGVRERQVGGDTSEVALLLVALADLYSLVGRLAPALEFLQQAVGKLGPSKDSNLAGALEKLAAVYVRTGRYEDAADCYQRAFDCWAGDPDVYAERIAANRQALESLAPWLPPPAEPVVKPETPDTGISVLRPPGFAGGAVRVMPAGAAGLPPGVQVRVAGPGFGPQIVPAGAPAAEAGMSAAGGAPPVFPPGFEPAPPAAEPLAPPKEAAAAGRQGAGGTADLAALSASVAMKRDAHGFCGWEELEFERLAR